MGRPQRRQRVGGHRCPDGAHVAVSQPPLHLHGLGCALEDRGARAGPQIRCGVRERAGLGAAEGDRVLDGPGVLGCPEHLPSAAQR
eukprot:10132230-Heterocapsa_arctica.AAC.1